MAVDSSTISTKDLPVATLANDKYLLGRNDADGLQQIDYNLLAKAIIEQYSSSNLGGTNQTLKSAIDSLNSGLTKRIDSLITRKSYSVPINSLSQDDRAELSYAMQPLTNTTISGLQTLNGMVTYWAGALCFVNLDSNMENQQFIKPKAEKLIALTLTVQYTNEDSITIK